MLARRRRAGVLDEQGSLRPTDAGRRCATDKAGRYRVHGWTRKTRTVKARATAFSACATPRPAFADDAAWRRACPWSVRPRLRIGEPLRIEFRLAGSRGRYRWRSRRHPRRCPSPASCLPRWGFRCRRRRARRGGSHPRRPATSGAHIDRLGNTPYQLGERSTIDMDDGRGHRLLASCTACAPARSTT